MDKTIENTFGDKEFRKNLSRLAMPTVIQSLMLALVAATDAFMLGGIEQNAMSAVSLATQIQFIQNMILSAATSATVILGAQYWGKGDTKTLNAIFCICLRLCGLASIVFWGICLFIPENLMAIFTNETALITHGAAYLRIAAWSYLLTGISQSYISIMKVSDHPDTSAKISCASVLLNIALNYVLIYGAFGIPAMGVVGAAWATVNARVVELLACIWFSYQKDYIRLHPEGLLQHNSMLWNDFSKCALPLLGAGLLWGVGFTSYSAFMGHLGTDAAAGNSIAAVIRDLVCCACDGLAVGGGILVGNELGAGQLERGKLYGERMAIIAFICGFLSTLVMFLVTPIALQFVQLTDTARELLQGMMCIMAIYMIGRCVNTIVINGVFAAGGDTVFDMYSLAVTMWGIAVPLAAMGTFLFHWHPLLVYACTCLDEVGKIPWVMLHFKKYRWVKDLTRENPGTM